MKTQYVIQQHKTITELKTPDFEQNMSELNIFAGAQPYTFL